MYKVGGVYLDIKSNTDKPFDTIIRPDDTYILCHWKSKEHSHYLKYPNCEFQQWHIISQPKHPFLKEVIQVEK